MNNYVNAYKIGSGDITWIDFIEKISKLNKPILLATGASDLEDTKRAVDAVLNYNPNICFFFAANSSCVIMPLSKSSLYFLCKGLLFIFYLKNYVNNTNFC